MIRTAGGRPYGAVSVGWTAFSGSGSFGTQAKMALTVDDWPRADLAALLANCALPSRQPVPSKALAAIVPPALGRWVLQRALALGLEVDLVTLARRPLSGEESETGALMLTLRSKTPLPGSLIHTLGDLPDTLLAHLDERIDTARQSLFLDIRCRCPLPEAVLRESLPATEPWALGTPDVGHWRFRRLGTPIPGLSFLYSAIPDPAPFQGATSAPTPPPIPVRLVRRREIRRRSDAVLLEETELRWSIPLLVNRPAADAVFLLPGAGRYLLTTPGGLDEALPFGIPLVRIGPGGLYREQDWDFHPPLPVQARRSVLAFSERQAVAATAEGIFIFEIDRCLPAWALWVGPTPVVQGGLTAEGERCLERVAETVRTAAAQQFAATFASPSPDDRPRLLEQAQRAEWAGDWVGAAELLEAAGEPARAARLYEQAAGEKETNG